MKYIFSLIFVLVWFSHQSVTAQQYDKLVEFKGQQVKVYYSHGFEDRVKAIAPRVDKAYVYFSELLGLKPNVKLLVLSQDDWSKYTNFPVYGMAHYDDKETLIVAAEDNDFWRSFIPPVDKLPEDLRADIQRAYSKNGVLTMEPFFDLLALHELGHAFHFQGELNMQRKWMGELFVNILLHTYVAEKEPASLPALTVFPKMVVNSGSKEYTFTSLTDVHERYEEIGRGHAKNYGWYQSRWHMAAGDIYDRGGKRFARTLWDALKKQNETLTDDQLLTYLDKSGAKLVADMVRRWETDRIK